MCHRSLLCFLSVLGFCARVAGAHECAPCALRSCPLLGALGCGSGRVLARDPCGCCEQCSRLELELCGGPDWTLGYCGFGLTCAALNRTGPALIPETGVCRGQWRARALPWLHDTEWMFMKCVRPPMMMKMKMRRGSKVVDFGSGWMKSVRNYAFFPLAFSALTDIVIDIWIRFQKVVLYHGKVMVIPWYFHIALIEMYNSIWYFEEYHAKCLKKHGIAIVPCSKTWYWQNSMSKYYSTAMANA